MANQSFSNILLMARPNIEGVPETLSAVIEYLQNLSVNISIEETAAPLAPSENIPVYNDKNIPNTIDIVIVIGGDGSLLSAAHLAIKYDLPVLGIHRGRLGFLTDIHPTELDKIGEVLAGQYEEKKRFFIEANLHQDNHVLYNDIALNDVVLLPGDNAQMIEFDTHVNGRLVYHQRADGMIVATPTGSTAYALSGGGPILHPTIDAIVLVPMFPHTLSSRPIVIEGNSEITMRVKTNDQEYPAISFDGKKRIAITPNSTITIKKYPHYLRLIHPLSYGYFKTLREKLGWEHHASRN